MMDEETPSVVVLADVQPQEVGYALDKLVQQGKVEGNKVSFVEIFKFDGNDIHITYTGQITSDDEIKFTRQVAEFATEELVAKRVK